MGFKQRGRTSVVSFSCDLETLNWIENVCVEKGISRGAVIRYYLRMGRVYVEKVLANGVINSKEKEDAAGNVEDC